MAKLNLLDRIQALYNPQAVLRKLQARNVIEQHQRAYEATGGGRRNEGWFRPNTTAAEETLPAFMKLSATGSDLVRNNPLAKRIKSVWSANIVGAGVYPQFKASKAGLKQYQTKYMAWAKSTAVDFDGVHHLGGLERLWAGTLVEQGGVFIRKVVDASPDAEFPLRIQTLEQSYLDIAKQEQTNNYRTVNGIRYDANTGKKLGWWLKKYINNTGIPDGIKNESEFVSTKECFHIYDKERAGQPVGVSWFAPVANTLANYDRYMDAKLMQQSIASCFGAIVTGAESAIGASSDKNPEIDAIEPGMIEYFPEGGSVTTLTPPKADNSTEFDIGMQRQIAVGCNISYEQLTGDYSRVNFASGRMGKTDFFAQLDHAQFIIFGPALDKVVTWFNEVYLIQNGPVPRNLEWRHIWPQRQAVNPREEFNVLFEKVRSGQMSPSELAQALGNDLETIAKQWKEDIVLFDKLGLKFDIDPRFFARTGNQLDDNDAASANIGSEAGGKSTKKEPKQEGD